MPSERITYTVVTRTSSQPRRSNDSDRSRRSHDLPRSTIRVTYSREAPHPQRVQAPAAGTSVSRGPMRRSFDAQRGESRYEPAPSAGSRASDTVADRVHTSVTGARASSQAAERAARLSRATAEAFAGAEGPQSGMSTVQHHRHQAVAALHALDGALVGIDSLLAELDERDRTHVVPPSLFSALEGANHTLRDCRVAIVADIDDADALYDRGVESGAPARAREEQTAMSAVHNTGTPRYHRSYSFENRTVGLVYNPSRMSAADRASLASSLSPEQSHQQRYLDEHDNTHPAHQQVRNAEAHYDRIGSIAEAGHDLPFGRIALGFDATTNPAQLSGAASFSAERDGFYVNDLASNARSITRQPGAPRYGGATTIRTIHRYADEDFPSARVDLDPVVRPQYDTRPFYAQHGYQPTGGSRYTRPSRIERERSRDFLDERRGDDR